MFEKQQQSRVLLATYPEKLKLILLKHLYQFREKLFNKLDSISIPHEGDRKPFKSLETFDFQKTWVKQGRVCETETNKKVGKRVPKFPSNSSTW